MADLYRAAERGNVAEVESLLKAQADVTYKGGWEAGWTPLHIASAYGRTDIVEMLIQAKAPINAKGRDVATPLHLAVYNGKLASVEALISAGAPLDDRDSIGNTPLHDAACRGQHSIIRVLIASGASADLKNKHGKNPRESADNTTTRDVLDRALLLESKFEKQVPLDRVKIYFCGDGAVGKSTLAWALQRDNHLLSRFKKLPKSVDERTHGFAAFPATIPTAGACTIVDFAGQPEFWAPNAVFMDTVSGVFVVLSKLTDPFDEQFEQLQYWVRFIASQSRPENKPRVVLVGTHRVACTCAQAMQQRCQRKDNTYKSRDTESRFQNERITAVTGGLWSCRSAETFLAELREQLGHLVDLSARFHYIDSVEAKADRAEMASLRKCLHQAMRDIRATRTMPKVCADVISLLPVVRKSLPAVAPFESVQHELKRLVKETTVDCDNVSRMKAVLGYLSEAGHVMYFEDIGDMVVVDPQAFGTHVIGQLFCPVATEGFTSLVLTEEDGLHFRESQLNAALQGVHERGHIFGDVAVILKMLVALELVIPVSHSAVADADGEAVVADRDPLYAVPGRLCAAADGGSMQRKYLIRPDDCWDLPLTPELWLYIGVRLTVSESQLMIPAALFPQLQHRLSKEPSFRMWRGGLATRALTDTGKVAVEAIVVLDRNLKHIDVCVRSETSDHPTTVNTLLRIVTACEKFDVFFTCSIITSNSMKKHVQGELCCDGHTSSDRGVKPSAWVSSRFSVTPKPQDPLSVVASCPHTMSVSNTPPYSPVDNFDVFDVFEHCQRLQRAGRLKLAFDRSGSSTVSPRDAEVVWSIADAPGATEEERWAAVKESVARSGWFEGFQTRIKAAVMSFVQSHPDREIHLLCIRGGPITELEQEAMSKIVLEVQADMALYQIHSRIKIELLTYSEFVDIFGHPHLL